MNILLYDNYDSFTYNLLHVLEAVDPSVRVVVIRNDEGDLERWKDFDKVVLSPGPGLPQESGRLMEFIQSCEGKIPILGVCLGLQALTLHFGGGLFNLKKVLHGVAIETSVLDPTEPIFNGIPLSFPAGRYHSWVADRHNFPSQLKITATDANGQIMAFRHREKEICAVQFHPESILTPHGRKILQNWVKSC